MNKNSPETPFLHFFPSALLHSLDQRCPLAAKVFSLGLALPGGSQGPHLSAQGCATRWWLRPAWCSLPFGSYHLLLHRYPLVPSHPPPPLAAGLRYPVVPTPFFSQQLTPCEYSCRRYPLVVMPCPASHSRSSGASPVLWHALAPLCPFSELQNSYGSDPSTQKYTNSQGKGTPVPRLPHVVLTIVLCGHCSVDQPGAGA